MDAFSHLQVIEFNRHQATSIEQALQIYQAKLEAHQAFDKSGRLNLVFMDNSSGAREHLQLDNLQDKQLAMKALSLNPDGGYRSNYIVSSDRELYLSETLLFALALEHESLIPQLRNTAQAMVNYARFENDTSKMWLDDTRVFGAEPLYMMAAKDANDAVYLAQFFIPYWDDEHATGYEDMLLSLLEQHGWCEAMINAFIWCDNPQFRFAFYGSDWEQPTPRYQPLGDYLKANPAQYPRFIELVKQRFHGLPVLVYSENEPLYKQNPVLDIYTTLLAECCGQHDEDRNQELAGHFINDSLENEAMDLQNQLKLELNKPLCCYAGSVAHKQALRCQRDKREKDRDKYLGGLHMFSEFIASLENSHDLLAYISTGENPQVLDDIQSFNFIKHCKQHALSLFETIDETCWEMNNFNSVRENFHEPLHYLAKDLMQDIDDDMDEETVNGFIRRVSIRSDVHSNNSANNSSNNGADIEAMTAANTQPQSQVRSAQTMLRFIDIFYRLFDQQPFDDELCDILTGESVYQAIISAEDYYARFMPIDATAKLDTEISVKERKSLESLLDEYSDMDSAVTADMLEQSDELFANRACLNSQDWPEDELGIDALCAYLLLQDKQHNINDDYTQALQTKLSGVFERAVNLMLENADILGEGPFTEKGLNDSELAQVKGYFTGPTPELHQQQMIALLNQHLYGQDICRQTVLHFPKISPMQKSYLFLNDYDEDYQRVVLACFWLKQLNSPEALIAKRIWQLLVAMAPIRIIGLMCKAFSEHTRRCMFDTPQDEINFFDMLNSHGIDKAFTQTYQVEQYIDRSSRTDDYLNLVELMGELVDEDSDVTEPGMIAAARRQDAKALLCGLDYSYQPIKLSFHKHVAMRFPSRPLALDNELQQCLEDFIKLNNNSWEQVIERKFKDATVYFDFLSDESDLPKKLRLPVTLHPNADLNQTRHCDKMSWINATIAQHVGDELQILVADKNFPRDGNLYIAGQLLIINDSVDAQSVINAVAQLPSSEEREQLLKQNLWAYLQGHLAYDAFATQFSECIEYETVTGLKERQSHSLGQYLWLLDDERCGRLLHLLANHSYRSYKIIFEQLVTGYMDQLALQGKMDLATRLECDEDDYEQAAYQAILDWLFSHDVKPEYLLLHMIKNYHPCMADYIAAMARRDEIKSLMPFLHIQTKADLVDILAEQADCAELMSLFTKEKSRQIRDRVEAALK
ncbi:hypothetical protein [Shewanella sp. 30m-9]